MLGPLGKTSSADFKWRSGSQHQDIWIFSWIMNVPSSHPETNISVLLSLLFYTIMFYSPIIRCHPEVDECALEQGSFSSSVCLREFFLATVTSGLFIRDLNLHAGVCRTALSQHLLIKVLGLLVSNGSGLIGIDTKFSWRFYEGLWGMHRPCNDFHAVVWASSFLDSSCRAIFLLENLDISKVRLWKIQILCPASWFIGSVFHPPLWWVIRRQNTF